MPQQSWSEIILPSGNEDLLYELFHENSKNGRHTQNLSQSDAQAHLEHLHPSLDYEGFPLLELPRPLALPNSSLFTTLESRTSVRNFAPSTIALYDISALLYYGYGVTRQAQGTGFPRGLRVVPSGGALYPLELYLHTAHLAGQGPGLFHYNPERGCLRDLQTGDSTEPIANAMLQSEIGMTATVLVFITALFERSTYKYQDRGYRYTLLEAGHVAQNLTLVANALGYGALNIGGFFDREIDAILGLDGVTHSTIYMVAIGKTPVSTDERSHRAQA